MFTLLTGSLTRIALALVAFAMALACLAAPEQAYATGSVAPGPWAAVALASAAPGSPATPATVYGAISGTVSGPGGAPLLAGTTGFAVVFNVSGAFVTYEAFSDDGVYTVAGLDPGDYKMGFEASAPYLVSWWHNAVTMVTATPVPVTVGGTTTGVNQQLSLAGSISGTISGLAGSPLAPGTTGRVVLYTSSGDSLTEVSFSDDGVYEFTGLAAGDYLVSFLPDRPAVGESYQRTWWKGAATMGAATPIQVVPGRHHRQHQPAPGRHTDIGGIGGIAEAEYPRSPARGGQDQKQEGDQTAGQD